MSKFNNATLHHITLTEYISQPILNVHTLVNYEWLLGFKSRKTIFPVSVLRFAENIPVLRAMLLGLLAKIKAKIKAR